MKIQSRSIQWVLYNLIRDLFQVELSSVQSLSCVWPFLIPWTSAWHARLLCPPATPRACSHSYPLSRWCHLTISSSVISFFYLQSFPASRSFPKSPLFASDDQNTGASAPASVLPMNSQDWLPLGLTSLISLKSKELSRVFFNTTVQKH